MKGPELTIEEKYAIAERIRGERERLGYTQEGFANIVDLTSAGYKKIERAESNVTINTLLKLHRLNISTDYILFGREDNSDDVWKQVSSSSEYDKKVVFMRLMLYFLNTKDKVSSNLNKSDSLEALIAKLIEGLDT